MSVEQYLKNLGDPEGVVDAVLDTDTYMLWAIKHRLCSYLFIRSRVIDMRLPEYDGVYSKTPIDKQFCYVYYINRNALFEDIFKKLIAAE